MSKLNYIRSNRIKTVKFKSDFDMQLLCGEIIESASTIRRQRLSDELVTLLCKASVVPELKVKISDTKQYHKKAGGRTVYKRYGYYKPNVNYIYIQNLTAVRGVPLAGKTFIDTLLHEWLHHYDTHKLKLNSIHSKGFYERLRVVKKKLCIIE